MELLNAVLGGAVDALLLPFRQLSPMVGLALVSALSGAGMLLVFKATSDQEALAAVKRQISAGMFEIRLFSHDPRAILAAQRDILAHAFRYLRLTLVPTLWMIVPLVLVIIQLQHHYGYRGLEPGSTAIVEVKLGDGAPIEGSSAPVEPGRDGSSGAQASAPFYGLEAETGLAVETPPVRIPSLREVAWRIRAERPGSHELRVRVGDAAFGKRVDASSAIVRRSPVRASGGLIDQLLHPAEPPIRDRTVRSISVSYPEATVSLLGWETHWLIVYFILTIIAAFALRRPLGVTI